MQDRPGRTRDATIATAWMQRPCRPAWTRSAATSAFAIGPVDDGQLLCHASSGELALLLWYEAITGYFDYWIRAEQSPYAVAARVATRERAVERREYESGRPEGRRLTLGFGRLRQRASFAGRPIPRKHNHVLRGHGPYRGTAATSITRLLLGQAKRSSRPRWHPRCSLSSAPALRSRSAHACATPGGGRSRAPCCRYPGVVALAKNPRYPGVQ